MESDSTAVILAAGLGKRMQSNEPKAMIEVAGKPMLGHLHASAMGANIQATTVISRQTEEIFKSKFPKQPYRIQEVQEGTAHALKAAKDACGNAKRILVLYGDHPFVSSDTIKKLFDKSEETDAEITLASTEVPNFENKYRIFSNFAKILRRNGKIVGIREYKDAKEEEKDLREVNPGYYVFKAYWLWPNLEKIKKDNAQGEQYLTDLVYMAEEQGMKIENIKINPREAVGANSKEELDIIKNWDNN